MGVAAGSSSCWQNWVLGEKRAHVGDAQVKISCMKEVHVPPPEMDDPTVRLTIAEVAGSIHRQSRIAAQQAAQTAFSLQAPLSVWCLTTAKQVNLPADIMHVSRSANDKVYFEQCL